MKTKQHIILYFFSLLMAVFVYVQPVHAQWTQVGSDIDGEYEADRSGHSVSLNSVGDVVAIGAVNNQENGIYAGHVRVYQNLSGTWTQVGSDLDGEANNDQFGHSVSINSAGDVVAIGAPKNSNSGVLAGHVRVYQNIAGTWTQIGSDLYGDAADDHFGYSVSLNSAGNLLAIGAIERTFEGSLDGYVRIYQNLSGTWTQVGSDIDGEASGDGSGYSVSLNSAGDVVAIGAVGNSENGYFSGHVRVFQNLYGSWTQVGSDIDGEAAGDWSGYSVSLNSAGDVVAIGAPHNGTAGHVRVYQNLSGSWTLVGSDIDGEAPQDQSGHSVSLNSAGDKVAIGAIYNDGSSVSAGHVRVYENLSGSWTQVGSDIDGEWGHDQSGYSVSLNAAGDAVAVGAPYNFGVTAGHIGHVRVFNYSAAPVGCDYFTVCLKDSNGDLLAGGTLEYRAGGGTGWQPATEVNPGTWCINTTKDYVALRMTYDNNQIKVLNVPTDVDYCFQTVKVTVELLLNDCLTRGYNGATVEFAGFQYEPFGTTGDDGLGYVTREMLPVTATFGMIYNGIVANPIRQDISIDPLVTFCTEEVCVELKDKDDNPVDGAEAYFKGHGWKYMGDTGDDDPGKVCVDMIQGNPQGYCNINFRMLYDCGKIIKRFNYCNDPLISFQLTEVTVRFIDNDGNLTNGGAVTYKKRCTNSMGTTGDDGQGIVKRQMLPSHYQFILEYGGLEATRGHNVGDNPVITIREGNLKSGLFNGNGDITMEAYPNPFDGSTTIAFGLDKAETVNITILDINGKVVDVLHEGQLQEGNHKLVWNANDLKKGIYIVRLVTNGMTYHKNIVKM